MLVCPELAGPAHAGLDLVDHQKHPLLGTERGQAPGVVVRQRFDPALALNHLNQHCGRTIGHGVFHGRQITKGHGDKALGQRAESGLYLVLARGRQGGQGAAMKGTAEGDDLVAFLAASFAHVASGQFDGALVGLGPGVAEKDPLQMRCAEQASGQADLLFLIEKIGNMDELFRLGANDLHQFGVGMAQVADRDTGQKVEVGAAFGSIEPRPLAPAYGQGIAGIRVAQGRGFTIFYIFAVHEILLGG